MKRIVTHRKNLLERSRCNIDGSLNFPQSTHATIILKACIQVLYYLVLVSHETGFPW